MAVLVILSGKQAGRKIRLPDRDVVIGRDEGCFLRIASADVSRQHCELSRVDGGWVLRDLKSQNGTLLNGKRINAPVALQAGDELVVGHHKFQWEGPRASADNVLDDSIAEWLSEHDTSMPAGKAPGDTTILEGQHFQDAAPPPTAASPSTPEPPPTTAEPKKPDSGTVPAARPIESRQSLAEEARAVIRHFVEQVGDGKPPALATEE